MVITYPSKNHIVSLPFGYDASNDKDYKTFYELFDNKHPGIDFDLPENSKIYSSINGIVVRKEFHQGMGNTLGIRNGNILSIYAHLNEILVNPGQIILQDTFVALSGNTGMATSSAHLHFELRDLSKTVLKNMVFEPIFNIEISNFKNEFINKVNNKNIPKNALNISERYFGTLDFAKLILERNNLDLKYDTIFPEGLELIIPNFRNQ